MKHLGLILGSAILVGTIGVVGVSWFSAAASGNASEQTIKASYKDLKNVLAQYGNKVAETAQVPEMYRDDVIAVTEAAIGGRYGSDGSKAIFQMLTEQNPSLDSAIYVQVQRVIESGRTDFENAQRGFLDKKRVYETSLGHPWQGFWLGVAGYPRIDLEEYDIVTSVRAEDAFEKKTEEPMVIRK